MPAGKRSALTSGSEYLTQSLNTKQIVFFHMMGVFNKHQLSKKSTVEENDELKRFFEEQDALDETQTTSDKSSSFLKKSTLDASECLFLSTSLLFFLPFLFCPPECFNGLCNFQLLPTLKSEGRRLGNRREKRTDLQHMIAKHYTEVSLRNIQNISA